MKKNDNRTIWKNKSELELMLTISNFIEKHQITTVRNYQKKLKEHPKVAPGLWFINKRYGSWDKLFKMIGKNEYIRYRWNELTNEELTDIVKKFIKENQIKSQREYEKMIVGKNLPSLSSLRKRLGDIRNLFNKEIKEKQLSNFEILVELRDEIYKLNLEENLSMTEFRRLTQNNLLPSPFTIMRQTNMTWEQLMIEIGFDYRSIKIDKLIKNLK